MTTENGNILIIDDDRDVLLSARLLLKQHFTRIQTVEDPRLLSSLLNKEAWDVILLDMNFTRDATSGREGFDLLKRILDADPSIMVILITAYGDVDMAVRAMKEGAVDFILKPWQNERLVATISNALRLRKSKIEIERLQTRQKQLGEDLDSRFHEMIGDSPAMCELFTIIDKVAATDANVLIMGENGTGKELAARALHRQSGRAGEVFIGVDMGAIPETLFESELFGHEKGAFTDAKETRPGRFEAASGGTLFLDEIANLSLPLQAKLLRALEERRITRLGSDKPRPVDIRLICATNANVYDLIAEKQFRQDLLYRINTVEIGLPPLRDRVEDIPALAGHFMARFAGKYRKRVRGIGAAALKKLRAYHWPGNIRELRHTIERAVIMSDGDILGAEDFLFPNVESRNDFPETFNLEEVERIVIKKALVKHGGNITHAAEDLGLTRAALYRRMNKHGL